jgi:hypothetical protein
MRLLQLLLYQQLAVRVSLVDGKKGDFDVFLDDFQFPAIKLKAKINRSTKRSSTLKNDHSLLLP